MERSGSGTAARGARGGSDRETGNKGEGGSSLQGGESGAGAGSGGRASPTRIVQKVRMRGTCAYCERP